MPGITLTVAKVLSSSCPPGNSADISSEDSDFDAKFKCQNTGHIHTNCFGEVKTSRYRRPPRQKKGLDEREKVATRRSHRIKQIMDDKKELDKVWYTFILWPTNN